jgi:hypothetical protein
MTRAVILHAHLFKNAGTTIDSILEKNFGNNFCDDRNDAEFRSNKDYLSSLLEANSRLIAVSSHSVPLPITEIENIKVYLIAIVRHPIARIRSVYDFERKQAAKTPGAIYAKKLNFAEYVEWRMRPDVGGTIRNFHVNYFTSQYKGIDVSKRLNLALEYIREHVLIGSVEKFDLSLELFKQALLSDFPDFETGYVQQNVTNVRKLALHEQIDGIKQELGDYLYQLVCDKNREDLLLYNEVQSMLETKEIGLFS